VKRPITEKNKIICLKNKVIHKRNRELHKQLEHEKETLLLSEKTENGDETWMCHPDGNNSNIEAQNMDHYLPYQLQPDIVQLS